MGCGDSLCHKKQKGNLRSGFIGRQLSRLKAIQSYVSMALLAVNALTLINLTFHVRLRYLFLSLPILLFATLTIGYILDRCGVISEDNMKGFEMQFRYPMVQELRNYGLMVSLFREAFPERREQIDSMYKDLMRDWGIKE